MKLYKRKDFIKLPYKTIYSKVDISNSDLCYGLFSKRSDNKDYINDWIEQDLISEAGYPEGITDGSDAINYQLDIRDKFKEFRTDLFCAGRDGMYEDSDCFVVWDKEDVTSLRDYLNDVLK